MRSRQFPIALSVDDFLRRLCPDSILTEATLCTFAHRSPGGGQPIFSDDEVVYIWGSETCPPLAYDGIKAHGSVCVTAYNIPPSQYGRVTEPCDSNRRRPQWANERFAFTVRSMSFLNPFTPYAVHRLSRSQMRSSGVMRLRRAPTGCAWTTRWSCSSTYVAMSLGMTHHTSPPFHGFLALWHAQHQPGI